MLLKRSCRDIAALLIAREDRPISRSDQVALKLHMLVCVTCPRFENQVLTMRAAMAQWRNQESKDDGHRDPAHGETQAD